MSGQDDAEKTADAKGRRISLNEVKSFSKSYIFLSALYVALGVVLIAWPSLSVRMIGIALGIVMIVLGITYAIIYYTRDNLQGFLQMDLVIGIVCFAFGIFILLNQTFLTEVLPFAMGIILLLGAVVKIQSSINMRKLRFRKWYLVMICAIIIVALGIVLLCNPFQRYADPAKAERYMLLYIGICLIFDGLTNLISLFCIQTRVRKLAKLQKANPDVDLQELLGQQEVYAKRAGKKGDIVDAADVGRAGRNAGFGNVVNAGSTGNDAAVPGAGNSAGAGEHGLTVQKGIKK